MDQYEAFVCLCDPKAVGDVRAVGVGARIELNVGGRVDRLQGPPLLASVTIQSICDGRFHESQVRHGGRTEYDMGPTAVVRTDGKLTVMITTRRVPPFSLRQLSACGLDPSAFDILVAKGVNAPIAAYGEVCDHFIRVNTPGVTCADVRQLEFHNRRRPMWPFEEIG